MVLTIAVAFAIFAGARWLAGLPMWVSFLAALAWVAFRFWRARKAEKEAAGTSAPAA